MSYIVNRTDGNIAAVVNDGVVDTSTSISLVGKGYLNYAETIAESLVALLENFSNTTAPPRPLPGQLWYDKGSLQLNIYNGIKFKPVNNVYVNTSAPTNPQTGDFWFNDTTKQLNFYRQSTWQIVAPAYSQAQGKTELVVETWNDKVGDSHTVLVLYVKGIRTVAVNVDEEFETNPAMPGFPVVGPGITLANGEVLIDPYFKGSAETAFQAYGLDPIADATYMHANIDTSTVGTVTVANDGGIIIGANSDITISVPLVASPYTFGSSIQSTSDKSMAIVGYGGGTIVFDNATNRIGINTNTPGYNLDLVGTLNVSGYVRSTEEYRFSDGSKITSIGDTIRLKPNGSDSIIINSNLSVEFVGDATFDSSITVNTDSTFNANVSASTTPSEPEHLTNKYYVDQLALKNFLPIGSIIMWYGSPANVPNGWAICNGLSGTPDLRDKFIMGAGSAASLGQSGGENFAEANTNIAGSHLHTATSDPAGEHNHGGNTGGHGLTAGEVAGHTHTFSDLYGLRDDANPGVYDRYGNRLEYYTGWNSDGDADSGAGIFRDWQTDSTGNSDPHIHSISNANTHTHTITTGSNGAHYHTFTVDNRPEWYALYYIMKIANLLNEV